jgi:hypothetical protein
VIRRLALPAAIGAACAGVVAAASFGALQALPRPSAPVTFGDRLAESISAIPYVRSVERVGGRPEVRTVCRRLAGSEYLLTILPRRHFLIEGSALTQLETRWHEGHLLAVEVALSGCPPLLTSLTERIVLPAFLGKAKLPVRAVTVGRRRFYAVSLTKSLELLVDRNTLAPIALHLFLRRLRSTSILTSSPARARAA